MRATLVVIRHGDHYAISRINRIAGDVDLTPIGKLADVPMSRIGRIGATPPDLIVPWNRSMSFYGKWFDQIAGGDSGYALRAKLAKVSREVMLEQVRRDNQYGLVGSYYSVFQAIMALKGRVPLVLIDDSLLALESFPVVLPDINDSDFQQNLLDVLRRMLRHYPNAAVTVDQVSVDGIDVEES